MDLVQKYKLMTKTISNMKRSRQDLVNNELTVISVHSSFDSKGLVDSIDINHTTEM